MASASRDFIVKGVGKLIARNSDGSIIGHLCSLNDMSVHLTFSKKKVWGGNKRMPIGHVEADRSGSISFTNNAFNLDVLSMATGALVARNTVVDTMVFGEVGIIPSRYSLVTMPVFAYNKSFTITVQNSATALKTQELAKTRVRFVDGQTPLEYVEENPASGQYTYSSGTFTFAEADMDKKVSMDYLCETSGVDKSAILSTSLIFPVEIYHKGIFVDDATGALMGLQTYAPSVIANGEFVFDRKRGTASSHKLTFDILDPQTGANVIEFSTYLV